MEQLKVLEFLEEKKDFLFPNDDYSDLDLEDALMAAPDTFELSMNSIPLRKPSVVQIISVVLGSIGVDRFYLGDILKGVLKYFTFGGFGIWWIVDIISAKKRCRAYNCKKLMQAIDNPSTVKNMQDVDSKISKAIDIAKTAAPLVKDVAKSAKDVGKTFYVD